MIKHRVGVLGWGFEGCGLGCWVLGWFSDVGLGCWVWAGNFDPEVSTPKLRPRCFDPEASTPKPRPRSFHPEASTRKLRPRCFDPGASTRKLPHRSFDPEASTRKLPPRCFDPEASTRKLPPRSFDPEALTNARTANGPSATPACAHRVCGRRRGDGGLRLTPWGRGLRRRRGDGGLRLTPWGRGSAADAVGTGSDPRVPTGSAQAPMKKRSWWFQGGFPTDPRTAPKFHLKSTGILNDGVLNIC